VLRRPSWCLILYGTNPRITHRRLEPCLHFLPTFCYIKFPESHWRDIHPGEHFTVDNFIPRKDHINPKDAPLSTYSAKRTSALWLRGTAGIVRKPGILGVTRLVFLLVGGSILVGSSGCVFLLSVYRHVIDGELIRRVDFHFSRDSLDRYCVKRSPLMQSR
jgi:hypothetical protein